MKNGNSGVSDGLTVLLAEDDENDVVLIRRAAKRVHMLDRLMRVTDGDEAIEYLRGVGKYEDRRTYPFPGVLVLDHGMPRLSGLDVVCWLRSELGFEGLPVVIFSNRFLPHHTEMAERLNAVCVLKTSSFAEIPHAIEAGIRSALRIADCR